MGGLSEVRVGAAVAVRAVRRAGPEVRVAAAVVAVSAQVKGGNSSAVERQPSKLGVAGSNPVSRSTVTGAARPVRIIVAGAARPVRTVGGLREAGVAPSRVTTAQCGCAHVAQLAEHALGKGEVSGSIPDMGSRFLSPTKCGTHGR